MSLDMEYRVVGPGGMAWPWRKCSSAQAQAWLETCRDLNPSLAADMRLELREADRD